MLLLTVKDVSIRLSLSSTKVYRLIEGGELAHHRIGGAIRISEEQIAEFLKQTKRERRGESPSSVRPHPLKLKHIQPG